MIDVEESTKILVALVERFDKRLQTVQELLFGAETALQTRESKSDEKTAKKLAKECDKIQKYIQNSDEKEKAKQTKLLNSNYLDLLEKEFTLYIKLLATDDEPFLESLKGLYDEAMESEFVDELQFLVRYLRACEESAKLHVDIYQKQLDFIKEVFAE